MSIMTMRLRAFCKVICFFVLMYTVPMTLFGHDTLIIDSKDFDGKNRLEAFAFLKKCHTEAYNRQEALVYPHNITIEIEVPQNASSLPLPYDTDFNGCRLVVHNKVKHDFYLFKLTERKPAQPLTIDCRMINSGDFRNVESVESGLKLLIVKDENPWTKRAEEEGGYDIYRRDVILVSNGVALNKPVLAYDGETSQPKGALYDTDEVEKSVRHVTFMRSEDSTCRTFLLFVRGQHNVLIKDIEVSTPYVPGNSEDSLYEKDNCFRVMDSAVIRFENVKVQGTYSRTKAWGYAVALDNVYDVSFLRFYAEGNWGVMGNDNANTLTFTDCRVNRIDLHCYGRDFCCDGCVFTCNALSESGKSKYGDRVSFSPLGSMYGVMRFHNCHFLNAGFISLRANYRAYTAFDVEFSKCTFDIPSIFPGFIIVNKPLEFTGVRREIAERCWPNISLENCEVNVPENIQKMDLFRVSTSGTQQPISVGYMSKVNLSRVSVHCPHPVQLMLSNGIVKPSKKIHFKTHRCQFMCDM